MTDLGVLLKSMSSVFNNSNKNDSSPAVNLNEDKTLKWRSLHNNQFACKKKTTGNNSSSASGKGQQINLSANSDSVVLVPNSCCNNIIGSNNININTINNCSNNNSSSENYINSNSSGKDCNIVNGGTNITVTDKINNSINANFLTTNEDNKIHKVNINMRSDQNTIENNEDDGDERNDCTSQNFQELSIVAVNNNTSVKKNIVKDKNLIENDKKNEIKEENKQTSLKIETSQASNIIAPATAGDNTTQLVSTTSTVSTGTKRTRYSPSSSERCLRRSKPTEVINSTRTDTTTSSDSKIFTSTLNINQHEQPQQRRRGRSKKVSISKEYDILNNTQVEGTSTSQTNDGPTCSPKKLRHSINVDDAESTISKASKKSDLDTKDSELQSNKQDPHYSKHKTRRSTRLEIKPDISEEMKIETKEIEFVETDIKEESFTPTDEKNFNLEAKSSIQQSIAEKTPKKRGRRAKGHMSQDQSHSSPSSNLSPEINSSRTSPESTNAEVILHTSTSSVQSTNTSPVQTGSNSKSSVSRQLTKEPTKIPSFTSQRPLRRIKPTAKILENDELRYEFETKNIARITACTEYQNIEAEKTSSLNKKDFKNYPSTSSQGGLSGITGTGKNSSNSSVCSDKVSASGAIPQTDVCTDDVKKKLFSKKNIRASPVPIYPTLPDKKPCPDPQVFLNEIKAAKLNLNRSPEDKKLNRKQQRRLLKQKEKHFEKLGLRRKTKSNPSESDFSSGEDEFVPANSKKINVGKTNVILRIRTTSNKDSLKDLSPVVTSTANTATTISRTISTIEKSSGQNNNLKEQQHNQQKSQNKPIPQLEQVSQIQQQQAKVQSKTSQETVQHQDLASTIQATLKQTNGKEVCSIPISTTGSVTITPISNFNANLHKNRRNPNKSPVNVSESSSSETVKSPKDASMIAVGQLTDNGTIMTNVLPSVILAAKLPTPENFICLCQKPSHYYTRNVPGAAYCCAIDNIEEQKVGCCNQLSGELLNLLRPSQRVGYMILCDDHLKRLRAHNCCATCGLFCTQGKFVLCQQKHFFHVECAQKFILNSPYDPTNAANYTSPTLVLKCPHCGQDTPEKTSIVTMKCQTLPVFLPSQKALNKPAKMSIPDGQYVNKVPKKKPTVCVELENLIPESVMNIVVREANSSQQNVSEFTSRDMFYAVNNDDLERVAEILASGYNVTSEMSELLNGTCLHLVAHFGTVQMAYLLLCRESSSEFLDLMDKEMRTALMCAIIGEKIDILKLLIQCGANLTLKGPDGMTALHIAAKLGNVEAAYLIVENHKNNACMSKFEKFINSQDDGGWTAIVWAAEHGFTEIVSLLLNYGANPNICDAENNSVLHWATLSNHIETISVLLRSKIDCSIQNINGDTPLHIACRTSSTRVCLMLIANGADMMVKNKASELPYDCIESEDNQCARAVGFNMQMRSFGSNGSKNKIICSDISNGREANPIQVIKRDRSNMINHSVTATSSTNLSGSGEIDDLLLSDFKYITKSIILQNPIQIEQRISQMRICNCNDGCNSEQCQCSTISIQNWYTPEGRLVGEFNFDDPAMIFECNDVCGCNKLICKNRVVQNGSKIPLQIFECEERIKGWGVRTLINIPRGTFIAEYVGEILTDLEADRRTDDSYFFDLSVSEYCIDANFYGNLTRFLNHSCLPNITPVRVYYDHQDYRFPKIAFFASKDISSGEELCFDYGEKFWSIKQKYFPCKCLYSQCRYSKLLKGNKPSTLSNSTIIQPSPMSVSQASSVSTFPLLSNSAASLLSSLSVTSRIPAGTTITTIASNDGTSNGVNAVTKSSNISGSISNNNSMNNIKNGDGENYTKNSNFNNRNILPNISLVL